MLLPETEDTIIILFQTIKIHKIIKCYIINYFQLFQEKECLEMQYRVAEKDMNDLRDKLVNANRSLTSATGNISNQEALICQLRGKSSRSHRLDLMSPDNPFLQRI